MFDVAAWKVSMVDFDGDNDLDAVASGTSGAGFSPSSSAGGVFLVPNTGTATAPDFGEPQLLVPAVTLPDGSLFSELPTHSLGDLDGDGDLDMVVGYWFPYLMVGGCSLEVYENTGGVGDPSFVLVSSLETAYIPEVEGQNPMLFFRGCFPALGDLDDDGDQDILMGVMSGLPQDPFSVWGFVFVENKGSETAYDFETDDVCFEAFSRLGLGFDLGIPWKGVFLTPFLIDLDDSGYLEMGATGPSTTMEVSESWSFYSAVDAPPEAPDWAGCPPTASPSPVPTASPSPVPTVSPRPTPIPSTFEGVLLQARDEIQAAIDDPVNPTAAQRQLSKASRLLEKAQQKWAKDWEVKALNDVRRAIGKLEEALKFGAAPQTVQPMIDRLLALVLAEAQAAIEAAIARGERQEQIEKAQRLVARGNAESDPSSASAYYIKALNLARK